MKLASALNTPAAVAARLGVKLGSAGTLAPRHYTGADNRIDRARVEAVATRWWAPQGLAHRVRRSTFGGQCLAVLALAEREAHHFATHPLAPAIDAVDQAIRDHQADPDSITREAAILAVHEGRPALLLRDATNHAAAAAVTLVHSGGDLAGLIRECASRTVGNADRPWADLVTYHAGRVLPGLVAANQAGADLLEEALWLVAEMGGRTLYRQAAE